VTIWLDVEDFYEYSASSKRPTGIQRLSFEIYHALVEMSAVGDVRFCRRDAREPTLVEVEWAELAALYARLTRQEDAKAPAAGVITAAPLAAAVVVSDRAPEWAAGVAAPPPPVWRRVWISARWRIIRAIPAHLHESLRRFVFHQKAAMRFGLRLVREVFLRRSLSVVPALVERVEDAEAAPVMPACAEGAATRRDIRHLARAGDTLLVLGSPWFQADYGAFIGDLRASLGMKVGILVYDLIPIVHPEWCDRNLVRVFRAWYAATVPHVDVFFAISQATKRDIESWARQEGMALRRAPVVIPIGTGFTQAPLCDALPVDLPFGLRRGGYVLFVSTIEARKNHMLAFRVWRRLLADLPRDEVPMLVFAGKVGWLVADLMQQISNANHLDGALMVLEEVDDATLRVLYENCRFTLFPSLYEGWGLPVTESLGFGKLCVAARRTSVPEAGGAFCLYFDPDDLNDATAVIRRAIEEPELVAALERKISAEFRPIAWSRTAEVICAELL
jgi:glycosyltransferase involved in cell wall biosynthesis